MEPRHARPARCARPPPSNRGVRGRRGQPRAVGAPVATPRGRGGPPPTASRHSVQDRTTAAHSHEAVTLSNENALSRFRACPDPLPPACGPHRAAHGPGRGLRGLSQRRAGMIPCHGDLFDDLDHGRAARPGRALVGHPAAAATPNAPSRGWPALDPRTGPCWAGTKRRVAAASSVPPRMGPSRRLAQMPYRTGEQGGQ
jgi:hypothetical protein